MDIKNYLINLMPLNLFAKRLFILLIIATVFLSVANYFSITSFNIGFRIELFYVNWYMVFTYSLLKYASFEGIVFNGQVKDFGEVTFLSIFYSVVSFVFNIILFA